MALPPTAQQAGYPLDRAPGPRGWADSDVVEVRSALPPTAVHAPSLVVPFCLPHHQRDGVVFRCQEILKNESWQCTFRVAEKRPNLTFNSITPPDAA